MKKKSKLTIKFYHGQSLAQIGKSQTGFPLYVFIRYKEKRTTYTAHHAMRFANSGAYNVELLRSDEEVLGNCIDQEKTFIENLRGYMEDELGLVFEPSMLLNKPLIYHLMDDVENYFNSLPQKYYVEKILLNKLPLGIDIMDKCGLMKFVNFLQFASPSVFDEIWKLDGFEKLFTGYKEYLEFLDEQLLDQISFLEYRFTNNDTTSFFKREFDSELDNAVRRLINQKSQL